VLLRREGWRVNAKRVWRLYREMGLQLRSKTPKRRVKTKLREGRADASTANEVWAMDFVHGELFDGRKIRVLTIIDTFTRLSPAIDVRQSYRGADVVATLERAAIETSLPKTIRVETAQSLSARSLIYGLSSAASSGVCCETTSSGAPSLRMSCEALTMPARYVVAPGGMIEYADISVDYRDAATRPN
jgi:transposase InsO family protein